MVFKKIFCRFSIFIRKGEFMISIILKEMRELNYFFKRNFTETIMLGLSMLFMILQIYHPVRSSLVLSYLVYFVIFPVFTILFILRKNPLDFGFKLGNYKLWGFYVIATAFISIPVLYIGSLLTSVGQYYTKDFNIYIFLTQTVPLLFAWEYLLRGFLLFGLKESFKEASILIQMVPFVLLHIGKPEVEILMCIPMGLWFGYIAYKGKSFWPAFITHVFINFALKYFVNY